MERAMDDKVVIIEVAALETPMDKREKKAKAGYWFPWLLPSVEEVFKWAPFQLPVKPFQKKKNKSGFQMTMPVLSVQGVLEWALLATISVALTLLFVGFIVFANIPIPCSEDQGPWWMLECPDLTPAQDVEVNFLTSRFLWFTVPQASAATVGRMLPRRHARSRWSLAFLALVSAGIAHYMEARSVLVFIAANPGDILFRVLGGGGAILYVGGDVIGILSLLIGGMEQ